MKSRLVPLLSRVSMMTLLVAGAAGMTACKTAQPSDAQPAAEAQATQVSTSEHQPGARVFKRVLSLDTLRPEQRAAVAEVEQTFRADLAPHRETMRQVVDTLASAVAAGELSEDQLASQQEALVDGLADARSAIARALNDVHDTLDQEQRAALVADLRANPWHEHTDAERAERAKKDPSLAKWVLRLALNEEQQKALKEALDEELDQAFPDRKARREAMEARMKAMATAFVSEDFDAGEFDMMEGAEEGVRSLTTIASRVVGATGSILSAEQRMMAAELLRERAAKL